MSGEGVDPGEGGGAFHLVQPLRDPASNWAVDLAKNLEQYLLKICSGEVSGGSDSHFTVNFAEAALLLQGSIQVYSRKVEYLYTLVLQALEFISQKSVQAEEEEGQTSQTEASTSRPVHKKEDDEFWCSDDIPVDAKNHLLSSKEGLLNRLIKPPANLVVLEGDCLDSNGDNGELETYLLATSDLYRDFILLDPCDAATVDDFLRGIIKETHDGVHKGSSLRTKSRKNFMSPLGPASGGTARKSTARKIDKNIDEPPEAACGLESNDNGVDHDPAARNLPQDNFEFPMDDRYSEHGSFDDSDSDEDDPWKPLNPHEPGNLKLKPFRKVKFRPRQKAKKKPSIAAEFPLARHDRPTNPLFLGVWERLAHTTVRGQASEPPSYFEKLRQSLVDGAHETHNMFDNPEKVGVDKGFDGVFEEAGIDMEGAFGMDEDDDFNHERDDDFLGAHDGATDTQEDPSSQATLEDLCRAHLDSLLASIAESEQQTELVARVTSWKQRIEQNLEEQDSRPPFDIHEYGEKVIEKFTLDDSEDTMPFTDIVKGQVKHEVTRTFSAMLQLVNDGKISLDKPGPSSTSTCYTAANPFYVRRLSRQAGHSKKQFPQPKKRQNNSPLQRRTKEAEEQPSKPSPDSPQQGGKFRVKKPGLPKIGRSTPESKRRRRSRLADPDNTYSDR